MQQNFTSNNCMEPKNEGNVHMGDALVEIGTSHRLVTPTFIMEWRWPKGERPI
jgi:hypothetical protein